MKIALIGAGPVGIEVALALKANNIAYIHFDRNDIAHAITTLPENMIFFSSPDELQIPGYSLKTTEDKRCTKEEYLAYLHSLVTTHNLMIQTYTQVKTITPLKNFFTITTQDRNGTHTHIVDKVIIATGGLSKPRLINIPGEGLPHVSHYLLSSRMLIDKRVAIVGGGNSALEAVAQCCGYNIPVLLSYRHAEFDKNRIKPWLLKAFNALVEEQKIDVYFNTIPIHINPQSIALRNLIDDSRFTCPVDSVLLLTGYCADMTLCAQAGVILDPMNDAPHYNPDTMESNVPGLYVIGTVTGGTQTDFTVFINTSHPDVDKIIRDL